MSTKQEEDKLHQLEDLEVREVSIVDHPAIRRKFLIVKRDHKEANMARAAVPASPVDTGRVVELKDDVGLLELLNLALVEEPSSIEKGSVAKQNAGELVAALTTALEAMMSAVKGIKENPDAELAGQPLEDLRNAFKALAALKSETTKAKEEGETKVEGDTVAVVTGVLERLMAAVDKLKALDPGAEVPPEVMAEVAQVASELDAVLQKYPSPEAQSQEKPEEEKAQDKPKEEEVKEEKAVEKSDSDPLIIFKVGSKMKKARLSKLKQAVEVLSQLIKEIEPDTDTEVKTAEPKVVSKTEEQPAKVDPTLEAILNKVSDIADKVLEVTKRLDTLEGATPTSAVETDAKPVTKNRSLWTGLF